MFNHGQKLQLLTWNSTEELPRFDNKPSVQTSRKNRREEDKAKSA